ncbi:MAG: hypothetical protein AAGI44_07510 [Pseudomonadota bacterium]
MCLVDTYRFYIANVGTLTSIVLPFALVIDLFDIWLQTEPLPGTNLSLLAYLPLLLFYPLYQAATVFFIASAVSGQRLDVSQCFKHACRFWTPLLILYVISAPLIWVGFLLLIIPGLIVAARLLFAEFYCLFDGMQPVEALKTSWSETRELQWAIVVGLVVVAVTCALPVILLERFVAALGEMNHVVVLTLSVFSAVLSTPPTVFAFRLYLAHQQSKQNERQP